jgi:hypothetical protein
MVDLFTTADSYSLHHFKPCMPLIGRISVNEFKRRNEMSDQKVLSGKTQDDVIRLLKYGVKYPKIHIDKEFLGRTVPLLFKPVSDLTPAEHIELWDAHNLLSNKLAPVTAESLEAYEELNSGCSRKDPANPLRRVRRGLQGLLGFLFAIVIVVILVQGYSISLTTSISEFAKLDTALKETMAQERVALDTRAGLPPQTDPKQDGPLKTIRENRDALWTQMFLATKNQCGLLMFFGSLGTSQLCGAIDRWPQSEAGPPKQQGSGDTQLVSFTKAAKPPDFDTNLYSATQVVASSAKAIDVVLSGLVLPMLLGLLGAGAYLTRDTLQHLTDFTYVHSWTGRYAMRFLMGGLLGVIGPLLYSSGNIEQVGLGLSLFAFLLGYSVELAFSLFDRFIRFAKDATKPESKPQTGPTETTAPPDETTGKPTDERAGLEPGETSRDLSLLHKQLEEVGAMGAILEGSLPPEYFECEVRPLLENGRNLMAQLGAETDPMKVSPPLLEEATAITSERHPVAQVLRAALGSFAAALGTEVSADTPAKAVLALFSGAVAAFKQGTGVYERWMAYLLSQPYTVRRRGDVEPSASDAMECLEKTTIFRRGFSDASEPLALRLMTLAQTEKSSGRLAAEIWNKPDLLEGLTGDFRQRFSSEEELEEGWTEYRHALLRQTLERDFPEDVFPGVEPSAMRVSEVLSLIDRLRENRASARDLDILTHMSVGLMKASQENDKLDVVGLIRRLLSSAAKQ